MSELPDVRRTQVGQRLREERKRLNLTQEQLADICGVRKQAQLKYEKGDSTPDAVYLATVADVGLDVLYVLTGVPSTRPEGEERGLLRQCPAAQRAAPTAVDNRDSDCSAVSSDELRAKVGDRLKEERRRLGLSQVDVAASLSIAKKSQTNYELGHTRPNAEYLAAAAALGFDVGYVLTGMPSPRIGDDELSLLRQYRAAPPVVRTAVMGAIRAVVDGAVASNQPGDVGLGSGELLQLLREYRLAPKFSSDHDVIRKTLALEEKIDALLQERES